MKWPWSDPQPQVIGREPIYPPVPKPREPEAVVAAMEPDEVELPTPTASRLPKSDLSETEREEYGRVCAEVGFECGDLIRERLKAFLHDENIHVYDNKQVVEYLDQELGSDWEWRGLRQADVNELGATGKWHTTGGPREVMFANRPYRGAIPLPVLLTIQKVQKAVPEVCFYISSPKGNDGDPFLMLTTRYMGPYVIERWDEPSFRER